ncbi:MAG TPA: hypothetical protein VEY71_12985 [Chitinophagales bacterium]|nr:hypothetical protein [Chitinophagales bacterium]
MKHASNTWQNDPTASNIVSWSFGAILFAIGAANLVLVHPVPGIVFLLLSIIYVPAVNAVFKKSFGFVIPLGVKIGLGIVVVWFTLGVSDLGHMIDNI